jgi:hypothetical protein
MIEAPDVVALMSKIALLVKLLEAAMEPEPAKAKVPADTVVVPV